MPAWRLGALVTAALAMAWVGQAAHAQNPPEPAQPISAAAASETPHTPELPDFEWDFGWHAWQGFGYQAVKKTGAEPTTKPPPLLDFQEVALRGNIGGRLEIDGAGYATNGSLSAFDSGFDLRRARLTAQGGAVLGLPFDYRVDLGYVPGNFTVTQAYVRIPGVPHLGSLEFGQFTPPVGLQIITSSWDISLMEPAAPLQAMAPASQPGVQAADTFFEQRGTWAVGAYVGLGSQGEYGSGSKSFGNTMGRITWLAQDHIDEERASANRYLHLGLSTNLQYSSGGQLRYRTRPESFLAPYVIDTGVIDASRAATLGAEVLWVDGPFSAQGEIIASRINADAAGRLAFGGLYAMATWSLTGESRPYNRRNGTPGRLIPQRDFGFGPAAGWGAFEAAARVSYTDLSDGSVQGGKLSMLMTSLNWYLRPQLKCMFEIGAGRVSGTDSDGRLVIGQMRLGVNFY